MHTLLSPQLEILWKRHGDYACKIQDETQKILTQPDGMMRFTREAQGALLLSYLTNDVMQVRRNTGSK